jgi:hypothetical protein
VGSSASPMSIDVTTAFVAGSITATELDALQVTQMLPSGLSPTAVGI